MMALEIAQLIATPGGKRLYNTLKRIVDAEGIPVADVLSQSVDHLEKMEQLARTHHLSVKQVADDSVRLYEEHLLAR